jgi:hypothetical protein
MVYVPDHWLRPKQKVDRDFLWGVLHTLNPDFVKQLVANANKERMVTADLEKEELTATVCQEVADMISMIPYTPSK